MNNASEYLTGIGDALRKSFSSSYAHLLPTDTVNGIVSACFEKTQIYNLEKTYQTKPEEKQTAMHRANMDILELFIDIYIRQYPDYKYCKGKTDAAQNVINVLENHGIIVSIDTYNSWRRKNYRLIQSDILDKLLELLKISPDNLKRLVYAHVLAQRECKKAKDESDIFIEKLLELHYRYQVCTPIGMPRPPCAFPI